MRPSLAVPAVLVVLSSAVGLAGCGDEGAAEPRKAQNTAGTNPAENFATAADYFAAVASNDPDHVAAAYELAAPGSPALSYLKLVHDGLTEVGAADTLTAKDGSYTLCKAAAPKSCHTFAAVVLTDGKITDFTLDGKKVRLR